MKSTRLAFVFFIALFFPSGGSARVKQTAADPVRILDQVQVLYNRGEYAVVVAKLTPLIYPTIRFRSQQQVFEAQKMLAISYVFLRNESAAEREFLAILAERPEYELDPLVDPAAAVEFFDRIKKRHAQRLREIILKERTEQESKQRQAAYKQAMQNQRAKLLGPNEILVRTVRQNPLWLSFIPLGVGQFQNRQMLKGYLLLGAQLAAAAVSIGAHLAIKLNYADGEVSREEMDTVRSLNVTQVTSGACFFALVAYGVADALFYRQSVYVDEKIIRANRSTSSLRPSFKLLGSGLSITF